MKHASLKQFVALQRSLLAEKTELETRLQAINEALSGQAAPTTRGPRKQRVMSAAARARISAAQKARWAKQKSAKK